MQKSAASLQAAARSATITPCSRIPHLRAHILFRQAHTDRTANKFSSRSQTERRHQAVPRSPSSRLVRLYASDAQDATFESWANLVQPSSTQNTYRSGHDREREERRNPKAADAHDVTFDSWTPKPQPPDHQVDAEFESSRENGHGHSVSRQSPTQHRRLAAESGYFKSHALSAETEFSPQNELQPERLLLGLLHTPVGQRFIDEADDLLFETAFCRLDVDYFVKPLTIMYRHMHPYLEEFKAEIQDLETRLQAVLDAIDRILTQRSAERKLTLPIFRHLLKLAGTVGNAQLGRAVWTNMMPDDGIEPDLQCFNYYLESICWNRAYFKEERFLMRVLPALLKIRARRTRRLFFGPGRDPVELQSHRVGGPNQTPAEKKFTIKEQAVGLFNGMTKLKLRGDEHTFINLMVAFAREGDLEGVKSILRSVWNIDVDALKDLDEEEIESPTFYEDNSPLRPSSHLLYCVAYVFGINNDFPQAFRLVDYISRNCNIPITTPVWQTLCEHCLVLSLHRSPNSVRFDQATGQLHLSVFDSFWRTMIDEPHNVVPDTIMTSMRLRITQERRNLANSRGGLETMVQLFYQSRLELMTLVDDLINQSREAAAAIGTDNPHTSLDPVPSDRFFEVRRKFLEKSLCFDRDRNILKHRLSLTLRRHDHYESGFFQHWIHRTRPRTMLQFIEFVHSYDTYDTATGTVLIDLRQARKEASVDSGLQGVYYLVRDVRAALDRDFFDLAGLKAGIQQVASLSEDHVRNVIDGGVWNKESRANYRPY